MSTKQVIMVGFTLFAMFFGAGNLIFPPALGFGSGEYFWTAMIAFVLTGVGLPLLGVIVGSISKDGYKESLKNIHPAFAVLFLVAIYLTIGPFFAIPRTATTAYEMAIVPFLSENTGIWLLIFSLVYFIVVLLLSLKPGTLVNSIGQVLTPLLLIGIVLLIVVAGVAYFSNSINPASETFQQTSPFTIGFTEGYLTMDAIAAIAFSVLVLNSIRQLGITNRRDLLVGTSKSALLAAVLLGAIYISLGWLANRVDLGGTLVDDQNLGTFLLTYMSSDVFGIFGPILLGAIVLLACLTTGTGLIVSVSEYFNSILPKVPYKVWVILFVLISFGLANQGLDQVIATSIPILSIIYPIAMTTVLLLIVTYFVPSPRLALQIPVYLVTALSILSVVHRNGWLELNFLESLPLFSYSFEWIPFMIAGYILGYLIGLKKPRVEYT
ncbi:MAG TPA: branched-chain amino acid transport system II carrier protein [Jeotgalicoccus sp.]|nr:branched-chain amino acid transport system II carrier protein [Jeotgalicoccus sp.]